MDWLTNDQDEDSGIATIPASDVVAYGNTTVYALWNKKIRNVYFNLNFNGDEDYIKVDGISVDKYGTNVSMRDILDAVFAMQSIQDLMSDRGITFDGDGYPTNYHISGLSMPQGKKGAFAEYNSYEDNWIVRGSTMGNDFDNWAVHFTSGDVYICVDSWD